MRGSNFAGSEEVTIVWEQDETDKCGQEQGRGQCSGTIKTNDIDCENATANPASLLSEKI